MKRNEDDPDYLEGLGDLLPAKALKKLNELLEQLHQSNNNNHQGSNNTFVYVASGAQYVKTQYQLTPLPNPPRRRGNDAAEKNADPPYNADTPLSALFRESHHEELGKVIDSWRPFLIDDAPDKEALRLNRFQFDFEQTRPVSIYMDLARLINHDALSSPVSVLAAYLFLHSNLSSSENALYVQLKRYKKMCK